MNCMLIFGKNLKNNVKCWVGRGKLGGFELGGVRELLG